MGASIATKFVVSHAKHFTVITDITFKWFLNKKFHLNLQQRANKLKGKAAGILTSDSCSISWDAS